MTPPLQPPCLLPSSLPVLHLPSPSSLLSTPDASPPPSSSPLFHLLPSLFEQSSSPPQPYSPPPSLPPPPLTSFLPLTLLPLYSLLPCILCLTRRAQNRNGKTEVLS
ncbi:hypothetical protein E2C01_040700 [Portunus trituberculatus]|uniref:Uncharacterized protein n=1 Tax=Portunus trituberculatus TaxID=210409 RepID=A0A5B7FNN8_PORTR|nr:hypothetical protein [Portunus trituberculatus]